MHDLRLDHDTWIKFLTSTTVKLVSQSAEGLLSSWLSCRGRQAQTTNTSIHLKLNKTQLYQFQALDITSIDPSSRTSLGTGAKTSSRSQISSCLHSIEMVENIFSMLSYGGEKRGCNPCTCVYPPHPCSSYHPSRGQGCLSCRWTTDKRLRTSSCRAIPRSSLEGIAIGFLVEKREGEVGMAMDLDG